MLVRDLINLLYNDSYYIEFRDKDNFFICVTKAYNQGCEPYLDRKIKNWFPYSNKDTDKVKRNMADIVLIIE